MASFPGSTNKGDVLGRLAVSGQCPPMVPFGNLPFSADHERGHLTKGANGVTPVAQGDHMVLNLFSSRGLRG